MRSTTAPVVAISKRFRAVRQMLLILPPLILFALAQCVGFPPGLRAENAPQKTRNRVLVFYANEMTEFAVQAKYFETLLRRLRNAGAEDTKQLADTIESDVQLYRWVIRRDQAELSDAARRIGFDLAIFTNELTLAGQFLFISALDRSDRAYPFRGPEPSPNAVLSASPLSQPEALRSALIAVSSLYPTNSVDLILITELHGSADMAVIPRVSTDLSLPGAETQFVEALMGANSSGQPEWSKLQGIEKRVYWRVLSEVGSLYGATIPVCIPPVLLKRSIELV